MASHWWDLVAMCVRGELGSKDEGLARVLGAPEWRVHRGAGMKRGRGHGPG